MSPTGALCRFMCALAWLATCSRGHAQAQAAAPLQPRSFAYGRSIELPADAGPVISLQLPIEVYRRSRSAGLADVVVFNATGALVPHALQRAARRAHSQPSATAVPFFPVAIAAASAPVELSLTITRGRDGQVLALRGSPEPQPETAAQGVGAYVLDARALAAEPAPGAVGVQLTAARFEWQSPPPHLILALSVDSSDDLIHWRTLSSQGGILHLEHAGQRIDRDRVSFEPVAAAFLRVRAQGQGSLPAELQAVYIEQAPRAQAPTYAKAELPATRLAAAGPVLRFDLGGPLPVAELELALAEDNSVVAAELWSSDAPDAGYTRVAAANFFRVGTQHGPRLHVPLQTQRYYELRVDPSRVGLGAGMPKLVVYYVPEHLLFLRRGQPPYTLAYGRYGVQSQRFSPQELLRVLPVAGSASSDPKLARLGEPHVLGGDALLTPPEPPPPYRTYALWAALIAGVLLLMLLALRLLRGEA